MTMHRSRFMPTTVEAPLLIEAPGFQIDATGVYAADTGGLMSVRINKNDIPPHAVAHALQLLGLGSWGWDDDLDPDTLADLVAEAAADIEADWADNQRDFREDR